jgi:SAM-dependent methyltransferase
MDPAQVEYQKVRMAHWDSVSRKMDKWKGFGGYYHKRLTDVYRFIIPTGMRVIEIGCGQGALLASVKPSRGVGIDISAEMLKRAAANFPNIQFIQADAHSLELNEKFDYIILSDAINDFWDVQTVFLQLRKLSHAQTRLIINSYSRLWELPLGITKCLGLARPTLYQNWLTVDDISGLLKLADWEVVKHWEEILCPLPISFISSFFNRFIVKLWPFRYFNLTHFIVARNSSIAAERKINPSVSIIIPARNEADNIGQILKRIPQMGQSMEMIFVEGHSSDNTFQVIEDSIKAHPDLQCKLFRQKGKGKGDAVRLGFSHAKGNILMILDADMTVPPEDLPRFLDVLTSGKAEFVNGVRLVYPMEKEAMRFMNLLGNKFFSLAFTWLLGQPVKDTLCGTKVLWKTDYERIAGNRSYFGDFDPFGDFDLLFGAAKLNLKIGEVPIRYRERRYGSTNISRWSHGWLLLRMVVFAIRRIKFF